MTSSTRARTIVKKITLILITGFVLWLVIIAPFATILALLNNTVFYELWANSLMFLLWPVALFLGASRGRNSVFRWWVLQYLGICAVCVSAAMGGVLLSAILPSVLAGKLALLLCFIFCAWGIYSAHRIHVVKLTIESDKLTRPVKLVQISDVHIGSRQAAFLTKVMTLVDSQKPDILVITGDLVDEDVGFSDLSALSNLDYPTFYCSGNHERYVDYQRALDNIALQGVTVLSDSVMFSLGLQIVGIEDRQHVSEAAQALETISSNKNLDKSEFSVLLYHQPDLWYAAKNQGVDLMLSGHTHKGQVWPFELLVRTRYRYVAGLFKEASSHLFVSQGTGTWGPIMRFGTRCEITVIELEGKRV